MKQFVFILTLLSVFMIGCKDEPIEPMPPEDTTPPKVVSVSPEKNSKDVPVNVRIFAVFSEKLSSKPTNNWFTLTADNKECPGTVNVKEDTILFATNSLEYETEYTAHISADVTDKAENHLKESYSWNFTTIKEPDTDPPEITGGSPWEGEVDVPIDTEIEMDFNETLDTASLYVVPADNSGPQIEGIIDELEENEVAFIFDELLEYSTEYTVYMSVTDLAGNETEYSWNFTTEEDSGDPVISSIYPENGATDISVNTEIKIEFNKEIVSADIYLAPVSAFEDLIEGDVEINGSTVTFTLDCPLEYGLEYQISIEEVMDAEGNKLEYYMWTFTTEMGENAPKVVSVYPEDETVDVPVDVEIRMEFDKPINSVDFFGIANSSTGDGEVYLIEGDIEIDEKVAILTLDYPLEYSETYYISITVEGIDGHRLKDYQWSFTTEENSDE